MNTTRGFSLVEMMVAVSIFAIVMLVGIGALLSIVSVNKRSQAVTSVMNNLNAAVEEMTRNIRVGTAYHCEMNTLTSGTAYQVQDCAGGHVFALESSTGSGSDNNDQLVYWYDAANKRIMRSKQSGANGVPVTAPEVQVTSLDFYTFNTAQNLSSGGNTDQARVLILIRGTAMVAGAPTDFFIQSGVTQRILDI